MFAGVGFNVLLVFIPISVCLFFPVGMDYPNQSSFEVGN
jgi:maltodextrin utilization protein YvdJ